MNYTEIILLLPRKLRGIFWGIPQWVESKLLNGESVGKFVYRQDLEGNKEKWLNSFNQHKNILSTIMFIYFLQRFLYNSYKMTKETLEILKE
jgi:hypothetical protein